MQQSFISEIQGAREVLGLYCVFCFSTTTKIDLLILIFFRNLEFSNTKSKLISQMIINSISTGSSGTCLSETSAPSLDNQLMTDASPYSAHDKKISSSTLLMDENASFQYFGARKPDQHVKTCKKCHLSIDDRYIFNIKDSYWHEDCLKCSQCGLSLRQKCYESENGALYCRDDYIK